jgi:uncharacterized membrane protein
MTKLYRPLSLLLWAIGLLATIVAVVGRLVPRLSLDSMVELRSLLLLASVLFLGAIATRAMGQPASS